VAWFGNKAAWRKGFDEGTAGVLHGRRGQMAVEMAVVMPVLLAVVGIAINLMVYLGDCARFDRVAAEAVRTQACSPGYGSYGSVSRAQDVQATIEQSFADAAYLSFAVEAHESGLGSGGGGAGGAGGAAGDEIGFSLFPHQETFVCTMNYRSWGFGDSFFGVRFAGIPHTRIYVVDPYRPGVLL
jgi:hypothetical protein